MKFTTSKYLFGNYLKRKILKKITLICENF